MFTVNTGLKSERISNITAVMVRVGISTFLENQIGLLATKNIDSGSVVGDVNLYNFEEFICSWKDYEQLDSGFKSWIDDYCLGIPEGFIIIGNPNYWPAVWNMNHHCDGNVGFDDDYNFIATKDIRAGEEVCYDYGLGESNPGFKMECQCNSKHCRKIITGNDWKQLRDDDVYNKIMIPYLRK